FLPSEVNSLLKNLQNQAPPLAWEEIEKVLRSELGEKLSELDVEPQPIASASLGQVYRAKEKKTGREFALKVQYPGVDRAIEGDIKALRTVLSITKLIPKGPRYDAVFEEIREMLYQELDYAQELKALQEFREKLKPYPIYIVPEGFPEYSSRKVL